MQIFVLNVNNNLQEFYIYVFTYKSESKQNIFSVHLGTVKLE